MTQISKNCSRLSHILLLNKERLSYALLDSLRNWEKYTSEIGTTVAENQEFARRELAVFVDYLALYFERGDRTYLDLYIGEKIKQCYAPTDSTAEGLARRRQITESDELILRTTLEEHLSEAEMPEFSYAVRSIHEVVATQGKMQARVLLVGDCLYLDVLSFLTGRLAAKGIALQPTFVTSKSLGEITRTLRDLEDREFDTVFFSPFSYEFNLEYSQLHSVRTAFASRKKLDSIVTVAKADAAAIASLLGRLFECPIFVHDSANVRRHDGSFQDRLKTLLTYRNRRIARESVNAWLPACIAEINAATFPHVHSLEESAALQQHSDAALGKLFYKSELQHPAAFGRVVAEMYDTVLSTQILLAPKKVLVCDLDNTLWRGVIGEGAVEHYTERQNTLRALKRKGWLLAINSKNDPRNVHWDGATLGADDFVSSQINWEPKAVNLRRIAWELNLKTKDFAFIDDRADEREMISTAMPEVTVLDADDPAVWERLALLAKLLPEQAEGDRTLMYKQREKRERFLEDSEALAEQKQAFLRLGIKLVVRFAEKKELKRVTDLINRTNQFNLCGTRTSLREVEAWHTGSDHQIFVVEAEDKFGSMGTVSILVARENGQP